MLYGAEIWIEALKAAKYSNRFADVERRGTLRLSSSCRTAFNATIMVIPGIIPI